MSEYSVDVHVKVHDGKGGTADRSWSFLRESDSKLEPVMKDIVKHVESLPELKKKK